MATGLGLLLFLSILLLIGIFSYKKGQTSDDFMLGSRGMNFYLTAFAAHASDMSSWIFLAYPAEIYSKGMEGSTIAIGLTTFMFLNWQFIAPKLRIETEKYNSLTISSYFESRFSDISGCLRIFSSIACLIFFTVYISGGLKSLGLLLDNIFNIPFSYGVILGVFIIIPYLLIAGYVTLAWTDCFQGIFLLAAIIIVPIVAFNKFDISSSELTPLLHNTSQPAINKDFSFIESMMNIFAWGIPYFGLPHILTKFMGIKDVKDMYKAKWLGISWQILSLLSATIIGLIAKLIYSNIVDPEQIFIVLTKSLFSDFSSTFILCVIIGATITVMDSQILVVATSLSEDLYKKIIRKDASSNELLFVTRASIFIVAIAACIIALRSDLSIMSLTKYAWFGLGATFSLLFFFLYMEKQLTLKVPLQV